MTLEVLFARAAQGEAFLLLAGCGLLVGAMLQVAGWLHGRWTLLGQLADFLCAALAVLAVLLIALRTGTGLRLYALLGLCIGLALYAWGIGPLVRWLARTLRHPHQKKQDVSPSR